MKPGIAILGIVGSLEVGKKIKLIPCGIHYVIIILLSLFWHYSMKELNLEGRLSCNMDYHSNLKILY